MSAGEVDEPLYQRIAATLRTEIADGTLRPGARLQSEAQMADRFATTRPTVRHALDVLRTEGLVVAEAKRGTFVRRRPTLEIRSSDRYRRPVPTEETSPFARDAKREGAAPTWTWETSRLRADEHVAGRLGIKVGDYVMRTDYVFLANGHPIQTSRSWEPFSLVGGTPIEEPEGEGRITGVIARMDSIGVVVERVVELVRGRPASVAERRLLTIPDDVWVQTIARTHWAGEQAVETCDIVVPADRYALEYDIPVR
jgi:DNA-binding GntR family transcriptional regulator